MQKRLSSIAISSEMSTSASQQPAAPASMEVLPALGRPTEILSGKRILVVEDEGLPPGETTGARCLKARVHSDT